MTRPTCNISYSQECVCETNAEYFKAKCKEFFDKGYKVIPGTVAAGGGDKVAFTAFFEKEEEQLFPFREAQDSKEVVV